MADVKKSVANFIVLIEIYTRYLDDILKTLKKNENVINNPKILELFNITLQKAFKEHQNYFNKLPYKKGEGFRYELYKVGTNSSPREKDITVKRLYYLFESFEYRTKLFNAMISNLNKIKTGQKDEKTMAFNNLYNELKDLEQSNDLLKSILSEVIQVYESLTGEKLRK